MITTRRELLGVLSGAAALRWLEAPLATLVLPGRQDRLSYRAHRTAGTEGGFVLDDVEGELPAELVGTLYRTAPGTRECHGVALRHLFDGDAYVSGYSFREGTVHLLGRFVATPERERETEEGRRLFSDYGTPAPAGERGGWRNPPSVHVVPWDGRLLGLSEGGHPTALDPATLAYQRRWNFHGSLFSTASFTAHPRIDAVSGTGYGYGIVRGPGTPLVVFRMDSDGRVRRLHTVRQAAFPMIHDMLLTERYVGFGIPPVVYDQNAMLAEGRTPAEALRYFEREPLRYLWLDREGGGEPAIVEQPAAMVYHHGNAYERDGKLVVDSLLTDGNAINDLLYRWSERGALELGADWAPTRLVRHVIDPAAREVESRSVLASEVEFPRWDPRRTGRETRFLYTIRGRRDGDPFAWHQIVRFDLRDDRELVADAGDGRCFGEPVFVPRPGGDAEDDGWVVHLGYDGERDATFVDVRDAATLDRLARVWAPTHLPLGFHGSFTPDWFVSV